MVRNPGPFLALLLVMLAFFLVVGCGGGEEVPQPPPPDPGGSKTGAAPGENAPGGSTVEANARAGSLEDMPFVLNQRQPVPPDFRAAYQRGAFIVVEFFKEGEDPFYPRGLEVDEMVNRDLRALRNDYPQIEFFTYEIDEPGDAETSEELGRGEYGTLAAQLEVGYTPFVAMLAPRGEEYVVTNLFQGYVERGVLDQALFELARRDVGSNASNVELSLEQVELTESGGGIEYVTLLNEGVEEADLSGFALRVQDPETGEVDGSTQGMRFDGAVRLDAGETASIGRSPGIVDADGREVTGTFEGGESLSVGPGDQVALVDERGAVVDAISI